MGVNFLPRLLHRSSRPSAPSKEEITQLKELLRKAGYDSGPAGGQWNATARKALATFQKTSGIVPASGLLNDATRIALGMPVASAGRVADSPSSVPPEKSVAMLGDSITANGGYGKDLQGHLRGWRFDNFGIVGNKTDQMNARLRPDSGSVSARTVDLSKYKTLILLGGVNDIASGRSVAAIEKDLTAMYDRADAAGVRVIPMTVAPWKGYPSWSPANQAKTNELNDWIRTEAQRRHYPLVDLADALSARHDSPPGDPAALSTRYRGPGTEGLLHPGDEGQKEMGELIWRAAFNEP